MIALVAAIALTSTALPLGAAGPKNNDAAKVCVSVQVTHDPAMLALYDEEGLADNPYYNADSLAALYTGLEQAVDQDDYFDNLPLEAQSALIASYVTAEGYVEFDQGMTRGSWWASTSYTAKNIFGGTLYSYSLKMYWSGTENPSNPVVSKVSGETSYGGGFGWGFKGEYKNSTSGYKNYNSSYWVEVGADFGLVGQHQYVRIEMTLYSDGTTIQPNATDTGSPPLWFTILNVFSTFF